MKRIYSGNTAPKYPSGKWSWDNKKDSLHFTPHTDLMDTQERYIVTNGFKFLRTINQEEELVFRQRFMRTENTFDADNVMTSDVRDLVLFLMPKEFLTKRFVRFLHQHVVYKLIESLNIYFDFFLRLVESILIRRDELHGNNAKMQSSETIELKRICSIYLSQYRMLVARNYSIIIKGEGSMARYYHMNMKSGISATLSDRLFHEQFLAVAIQIVWIAMHRRAYNVIEMEMNRLFRSEHFIMQRPEYLQFSPGEKSLLYGRRNKIANYRNQISPLILELQSVPREDQPILWIGERKYRGTDARIAALELEYIIPCTQLHLIDVSRGIMGHPKRLYNTLLQLDWHAVRAENYSLTNDPYQILRQPELIVPNIAEFHMRNMAKHYESLLSLHRIYEPTDPKMIDRWLRRESIVNSIVVDNDMDIYTRCEEDLGRSSSIRNNEIVMKYFAAVSRFRKSTKHVKNDRGVHLTLNHRQKSPELTDSLDSEMISLYSNIDLD